VLRGLDRCSTDRRSAKQYRFPPACTRWH
jgi:hypothetical protein